MQPARLIDDVGCGRTPAEQMAVDEAMLASVASGSVPVLRLYTWPTPALSLGRFQLADDVDVEACDRHRVEVVRRPSGGRGLLHGGDLTYAIALRRPPETVRDTYCHVASGLLEGLARLGLDARIARTEEGSGPACFTGVAGADLRAEGRKLCGSAMVRRGGAVLQHGSLLVRRLAVDESDLLVGTDREELAQAVTTLEALGATTDVAKVARALAEGFATTLDLDLEVDRRSRDSLPWGDVGRSLRV